jgi:hypothetical protein
MRNRFSSSFAFVAASAAFILSTSSARAQQPVTGATPSAGWLRDSRVSQGGGIPAGDLELHPGFGGEIGYDSNWFYRTFRPGFVNSNPTDAAILRLTPSFSVNTRQGPPAAGQGAPTTAGTGQTPFYFGGGASLTYMEFFGNDEIRKQRNVSGGIQAGAQFNRGRPVGFDISAAYARLIQPTAVGNPDLSFNRSDITAGAGVTVVPGGGTLDMRAGYQLYAALFEDSIGVPYTNITHEISFRDRWRFRPRTALFSDTTLRFISYPNADRATNYLNDSTPLRTRFGLTGLLTDRFGALLAAGYGATFFKKPEEVSSPQYDSVNAQAEVTWYLSQNPGASEPGQVTLLLSTITIGYIRDFQTSLLANYYTSNKGYAGLNWFLGPRAVIQLGGSFQDLEYPQPFVNSAAGPVPVNGVGAFTNYRLQGYFFAEYRLLDTVGINTTISYDQMISDTALPESAAPAGTVPGPGGAAGGTGFYDLAYRRFQAFLGARWFL